MSQLLKGNADYINLLLSTPKRIQAIALLDTATPGQVNTLMEIAKNVLHLPLSPGAKLAIAKRKRFLEDLANNQKSIRSKSRLLSKHHRLILEILSAVKTPLLLMIKESTK